MLLRSGDSQPSRRGRYLRVALVLLGVPLFLLLAYVLEGLNNPALFTKRYILAEYGHIILWPRQTGFRVFSDKDSLVGGTVEAMTRLVTSLGPDNYDVPELVLDVKYKEMARIFMERDAAIRRGRLVQTDDSFVKGKIRLNSGNTPVKLRLKGDYLDHVEGRKWSFRVHTRRGEQYFGQRRFSVQHPRVRGYQSEPVFFELARQYDILAPRWQLVNLTVNGEDIGLMAMEEHFSKELLESQSRREGIIMKFDETLVWESPDGNISHFDGIYDDYLNAPVTAFGTDDIMASPVFREHLRVGTGMMRSFLEGETTAAAVFDVEKLGAYLAISEVFGGRHPIRWHNMRFYLNPITLKLEPIGFDGSLKGREKGMAPVTSMEPITIQMLRDPAVMARFQEVMGDLAARAESGELMEYLRGIEAPIYEQLITEFVYLQPYPFEEVVDRAIAFKDLPAEAYTADMQRELIGRVGPGRYPHQAQAYRVMQGDQEYLDVRNAIPYGLTLEGVSPAGVGDGAPVYKLDGMPVSLEPRVINTVGEHVMIPLPAEYRDVPLRLVGKAVDKPFSMDIPPYFATRSGPGIPVGELDAILAKHEFMTLDEQGNTVSVAPGDWEVPELVSLPAGIGMQIGPATSLSFGPDAGLIIRGPIEFIGTPEAPVRFGPAEGVETWLGMAIMEADTESRWQHVEVIKTRGMKVDAWLLMGGTNFYASPVTIESSAIRHHRGEDGLNIIGTRFVTRDLEIEDTLSDGFDCDFCVGDVFGGKFTTIGTAGGGDAIDVSLSNINVDGVHFDDVSDKAVSIGEQSRASARNLLVENSGTGAAAKDGSYLLLEDSTIDGAKVSALMAYIKKPEFGSAIIEARRLTLSDNRTLAVAQTGSQITVDGEQIQTEDVDVDVMYETIMRPGLRRPKPQPEVNDAGT